MRYAGLFQTTDTPPVLSSHPHSLLYEPSSLVNSVVPPTATKFGMLAGVLTPSAGSKKPKKSVLHASDP